MKMTTPSVIRLLTLGTFLLIINGFLVAQTAVKSWGQLRVDGPDIVNSSNQPIQLQGMSLFWSQWEGSYYEYNTIKWLRDDWCINVIRSAMGVEDGGGYYETGWQEEQKMRTVIEAAIDLDIYVIIDWHSHYAHTNRQAAVDFFSRMAQDYGDNPNVIYEVFNEPLNVSWGELKEYHEAVIAAIRQHDPDNIIVCGTPNYSSRPESVVGNAINQSNIAYTLHYYAGSHYQEYRNRANTARNNGLCVFVTEYGLVNYDGNGAVNESNSNDWWNWMEENKISHCNWSLCDKNEGSAALTPGTSAGGFWNDNQLTWSGGLVRGYLRSKCPTYNPPIETVVNIPAKIEAEHYNSMSGVRTETTEDEDGGLNVGYIDAGDFMEYKVNASGTGDYEFEYRVASLDGGGFQVSIDGNVVHSVSVDAGGWQDWNTLVKSVTLSAGEHTIRIDATSGGWNINFINVIGANLIDCNGDSNGGASIDNCGVCSGGNTGVAPNACEGGCFSGYGDYGIKDDFTLENDPSLMSGAGVYSWGEETLAGDDNPNFQAVVNRKSQDEVLEVLITQGQGEYVPFGFGFGGETPNTINLTEDATFEFVFVNNSEEDVNVSLAIQDSEGQVVNISSAASGEPFGDAWMYGFSDVVKSGATYIFTGDFSDGYYADYSIEEYTSGFDYSAVATVLVTVTNAENTGAPNYQPLPLSSFKLQLDEMRIGDCSSARNDNLVTALDDINSKNEIEVFPNPTTGRLSLSKGSEWLLFDVLGNVLEEGSGSELTLSSYSSGVYFLKMEQEMIRIVKE